MEDSQLLKIVLALHLSLELTFDLYEEYALKQPYPRQFWIDKMRKWKEKAIKTHIKETVNHQHNEEIMRGIESVFKDALVDVEKLPKERH